MTIAGISLFLDILNFNYLYILNQLNTDQAIRVYNPEKSVAQLKLYRSSITKNCSLDTMVSH